MILLETNKLIKKEHSCIWANINGKSARVSHQGKDTNMIRKHSEYIPEFLGDNKLCSIYDIHWLQDVLYVRKSNKGRGVRWSAKYYDAYNIGVKK